MSVSNPNDDLHVLVDGLLTALADRLAPRVADLVLERLQEQPVRLHAPARTREGEAHGGLVNKAAAAGALGVATPTVDRWVRSGAPWHPVGSRKRFDLAELRTWVEARGRQPAAPRSGASGGRRASADAVDDDELRDLAATAGLHPPSH